MAKKKSVFKQLGFSWSPKRALGISQAKAKISKSIGIPLSKEGRRRKFGPGCSCIIWPIVAIGLYWLVP